MQKSTDRPDAGRPRLLEADEPGPFLSAGRNGSSNFVIIVDHASPRIPRQLADLGLPAGELRRHIAWDIGSLAVGREVAAALDAPLVAQNYSRLVIDCNRDPAVASSIPQVSEATSIPGNIGLTSAQIAARRAEIFEPYHAYVSALLDERQAAGRHTIIVAQHTMTDAYLGVARPMHAAIMYNRDRRFAVLVRQELQRESGLIIAENEPYFVSDESDYTIPHHAEKRGLPYVAIEIRQDLVADPAGQTAWARRVERALRNAERIFLGAQG